MARSLSIAAYLAGFGSADPAEKLEKQPPRLAGVIIWARCTDGTQLAAIETLNHRLCEDGDPVQVIATVKNWDVSLQDKALHEPQGKENIRAFLDYWKPTIVVWVRGDLDPIILNEVAAAKVRCMLVDATADGLDRTAGTWVPGAMRSVLGQFDAVFTIDEIAAERLIRAGARPGIVRVSGEMEDCASPLPCDNDERQAIARSLGTRPVWLAASADLTECANLCLAYATASHRAHRLLLIVAPREPDDAPAFCERMRAAGLHVALRSQQPDPEDPTQIYIVDTDEDLGLWYRIAPITYLGGTLYGMPTRDPFEPASLGSAVLHGPRISPFERHAARLNDAGASRLIRSGSDLGPTVESLLATDKVAALAHAAWDVTSRGADVTNRIVATIQRRLTELGY